MLLYFFKTQIRNIPDAQGTQLVASDYRVNLLISMIMDKYAEAKFDFAYQVSTIMSMTILTQFYGLSVSDDQKEKLVNGLTGIDPVEGGPFIADIPSLVFCLHLLRTETNIDKVREVVEALPRICQTTSRH